MKRLLLIFALLSLPAWAQVAVDNTGKSAGGTNVSSGTGLTVTSFAVGSGSNRLLLCGVSSYESTNRTWTLTFNTNQPLALFDGNSVAEGGGTRWVRLFWLAAPANATASVVAKPNGSVGEAVVGCTSWTGVDQTTPLGGTQKSQGVTSGANQVKSVTVSSATGNVVHDAISVDGPASGTGVTSGQTSRWAQVAASDTTTGAGQSAAGAASVTMGWTIAGNGFTWAQIGVEIRQPAPPSVATPTYDNDAGIYTFPVTVTISDATSGATIKYCTDTSNACTPSTTYSTPVSISVDRTYLRSQASKSGMADSSIKSALYMSASTLPGYARNGNLCPNTLSDEPTSFKTYSCPLRTRLRRATPSSSP